VPPKRFLILSLLVLVAAATGCTEPLTWAPPAMNGARVINVPPDGGNFSGNPTDQDCEVRMPNVPVYRLVKVAGCHDVKLVGGEFHSSAAPCSAEANGRGESAALYITDWTGTAHVEGVRIGGRGFSEGLWMVSTQPNSVGQVQGSWFGGFAACTEPGAGYIGGWPDEHPECFQTWAGPSVLRFDKNTCWTIYEGFNLDTGNWTGPSGQKYRARAIDIRRTNVRLSERSPNGRQCFSAWSTWSPSPTRVERASCGVGNSGYAPLEPRPDVNPGWWSDVFVHGSGGPDEIDRDETGAGYRSVGYR